MLVAKLHQRMRKERRRACKAIDAKYWPLIKQATERCEHDYGEEYLKYSSMDAAGVCTNLFGDPFVYRKCNKCGHQDCRAWIEEEDRPRDLKVK